MGRRKTVPDHVVLAHARSVFLEKGAGGSTKEIARRSGVSEAALFQRFSTKTALFLAAMVPATVDCARIIAAGNDAKDARAGLATITRAMLDYFREVVPVFITLLASHATSMAELTEHLRAPPPVALQEALARHLAAERAGARVGEADPRAAAGLLVAATHSLALFELMGMHGGRLPDMAVDALVDALWRGLAPATAKPRRSRKLMEADR